ncbi:MAG: hypothetical protein ACM3X4_01565 [Ignavibacteriales bacterium]
MPPTEFTREELQALRERALRAMKETRDPGWMTSFAALSRCADYAEESMARYQGKEAQRR